MTDPVVVNLRLPADLADQIYRLADAEQVDGDHAMILCLIELGIEAVVTKYAVDVALEAARRAGADL